MSEPKGPHLDLPDDLAEELQDVGEDSLPKLEVDLDAPSERIASPAEFPETSADVGEEDLRAELERARDRYLRLAAEFENYKRRSLKERTELVEYGNERLIRELLPTLDNLERALSAEKDAEGAAAVLEGVELTYRSLLQTLEKFGLQTVEALGREFDPNLHEAVRQIPAEGHPPGTVVEVYQKGYMLKRRLLRPALVGVAARD